MHIHFGYIYHNSDFTQFFLNAKFPEKIVHWMYLTYLLKGIFVLTYVVVG